MTGNVSSDHGVRLGRTEQGLCVENWRDEDIFPGIGRALVKGGTRLCCIGLSKSSPHCWPLQGKWAQENMDRDLHALLPPPNTKVMYLAKPPH